MIKTIIIFSSVEGQTKKICLYIKDILIQSNHLVDLVSVDDVTSNLETYEKIVLASSIRYGKHNEKLDKLIQDNSDLLNIKKTAFISVNLVARKSEKSRAGTNPYVAKFLKSLTWKPTMVGVFAGRLNYKLYGFMDRLMIMLIMLITKGPTKSNTNIEYTSWTDVNIFAIKLAKL
ncbi:menaquinone-dependent protoporphyrinogen IX dehydrogenase [Anditalea andensis]|uniref:Protoporphyrinogen IX dehydrogenase [quinone] n=1 Tax=Anditalea andensis TaxID=1048983 RepID=A0A074LPH8_9BACT|nr:menaquinone-dependent protoporphyrinogen IX dehydrogenase [Anditalea andensis]KEO75832.1 protoporphyrinogen oxidase [Anditalea andensis]